MDAEKCFESIASGSKDAQPTSSTLSVTGEVLNVYPSLSMVSFSCSKNLWVSKVLWCSAKCWQQIAWQAWDVVNDKLDPEAEF